ncbi:MAG: crossover junction endodeoxyribonuclease RuvC [Clostridia bacterium]|nr:crossover junction endodeoxyribonuclease RuvC [Clostridia bacterium]MBQ3869971.1 crossover junction endodeoxyribonuclease RuvC [Clostridia bacterium]
MLILGVDPGLAIAGWGVVEYYNNKFNTVAYGAITTPAGIDVEMRLTQIYDGLDAIIKKYKPTEMCVEELFFNTNQKTAIPVAEARGVILLCGVKNNVPIYEYTPLQVKMSVVGYGRAEKKQVIAMTNMILDLKKKPKLDDTSDALAIAICHAHTCGSSMKDYFNEKKKRLL